jgi:hypothetical protein
VARRALTVRYGSRSKSFGSRQPSKSSSTGVVRGKIRQRIEIGVPLSLGPDQPR